jgi:hypothetical protein
LKIGKCIWSRCHVVALLELQVDWINVGVVYISKSTHVTNNHVREFKSMPLLSRTLRSNLVTLVWLIVLVRNPIALSFSSGLDSSQVAEAWQYTSLIHFLERCVFLEGNKGGPNTSWFSYCVHRKPKRFLLPCNWLAGVLIIQYVGNLQVGVFDSVTLNQL